MCIFTVEVCILDVVFVIYFVHGVWNVFDRNLQKTKKYGYATLAAMQHDCRIRSSAYEPTQTLPADS